MIVTIHLGITRLCYYVSFQVSSLVTVTFVETVKDGDEEMPKHDKAGRQRLLQALEKQMQSRANKGNVVLPKKLEALGSK